MLGTATAFAPKAGSAQSRALKNPSAALLRVEGGRRLPGSCPNCDGLLKGRYNVNLTGEAVVGTATTGTCEQTGSVAAAFTGGELDFDGHGDILPAGQSGVLSIGATSCDVAIAGRIYSVSDGEYFLFASGNIRFLTEDHSAPCCSSEGCLDLGFYQPFRITGRIGSKELEITTYGTKAPATYAEGSSGSLTCTAPIENFI